MSQNLDASILDSVKTFSIHIFIKTMQEELRNVHSIDKDDISISVKRRTADE